MERSLGNFPGPDCTPIEIFTPSGKRIQANFSSQFLRNVSSHIILAPPHPISPSTVMTLVDALESRDVRPLPIYLIFDVDPPGNVDLVTRLVANNSPYIVYSKLAHGYLRRRGGFEEKLAATKLLYMNCTAAGSLTHGMCLDLSGSPSGQIYELWKSGELPCVTVSLESLPGEVKALVEAAEHARKDKARARKTGFMVGAAVRDVNLNVATAGNVERSATSTSLCAETFAILKADGDNGQKMIREVAVVGFSQVPSEESEFFSMPCGRCLQVMKESCPVGGDVLVYVMSLVGRRVRLTTLSHLLSMPYVSLKQQIAMLGKEKAGLTNGLVSSRPAIENKREIVGSEAILKNGVGRN